MRRLYRSFSPDRVLASLFFFLLLVQLGCDATGERPYYFSRFAMGTIVEYTIMAPDKDRARAAMLKAHQEIERIERLFSEEDSTSEIFRFNHSRAGIHTDAEVYDGVLRALDYCQKTSGAFDITIKPVLDLYGFQSTAPVPPTDDRIRRALTHVGPGNLVISPRDSAQARWLGKTTAEVSLTIGGFVKGYAVDRAVQILKANRIENGIVNAGGDIYCLGTKNGARWRVGIQHPRQAGVVHATLALADLAVATSGDYQRYFISDGKRYHHLLDPRTGQPARQAQSVSVIAKTTEEADVWATALFIMGPEEGLRSVNAMADIYALVIDSSGTVHYSEGIRPFIISGDTLAAADDIGTVVRRD